ncbi:hypothetical protein QJS04_geneDACA014995 [Acorus gramineus]|uniref:Reverse transcriptase/retrotransposon-derived protein RNase H-like domain-containing protein n=1 Tax=Acorus gramineus TaxID=55184 RepID=A0AAV9AM38_ACOGR|nr:hypothetical protein QJS04_geneDACA014995 [Acorus gramineus]
MVDFLKQVRAIDNRARSFPAIPRVVDPTRRRRVQQQGDRAGLVVHTPDGTQLKQSIRLAFTASNNVAEYEALLADLRLPKALHVSSTAHEIFAGLLIAEDTSYVRGYYTKKTKIK